MNWGPLVLMGLGVLAVGAPTGDRSQVRMIFNATASEPRGWYWVSKGRAVEIDDIVLARLPEFAEHLADQRGYLPRGVPILKRVGAAAGDRVCVQSDRIWIDGWPVARALKWDSAGRLLSAWVGCRTLRGDELFLINPSILASFDSRYFGPVRNIDVIGIAEPVLTW